MAIHVYRVLEPGFINGCLHEPWHKNPARRRVIVNTPFKPCPAWLEKVTDNAEKQAAIAEQDASGEEQQAAKKAKEEFNDASAPAFLDPGASANSVEVLG